MTTLLDISYGNDGNPAKLLDVYLPDGEIKSIFMYIHGGGLDHGDKGRDAIGVSNYLPPRGVAYVSINYRMYPDAAYPDYICDAADAVAFIKSNKDKIFRGCDKLYVGGSSAGGYISMMLCFDKRYLAGVGIDNSMIAGYFHDAGQPTAHFKVINERGFDSRRIIVDETAPLYYIGVEEKYPPMRFIVSDNDMRNRYEQTMLLLSTLSHFGYTGFDHVVMHGTHCAYCNRYEDNGESVFGKMIYDFIESADSL